EPELPDATEIVAGESPGVEAIEMIRTQLLVGHAIVEDVPDRDQDVVGDGNRRLLAAAPTGDAGIKAREVGIAAARGGQRALDQCGAEPVIAPAGLAAPAFAGAFMVARTERRPGGQVSGTGKTAHV